MAESHFTRLPRLNLLRVALSGAAGAMICAQAEESDFAAKVKPLLTKYCFDCHGDGMDKGMVTLDHFKSESEALEADELWARVLKNVRAGLMPPQKKKQPTLEEVQSLEHWIKNTAFGIDPANPDPGRVTVRRLNRVEYRNTIRDLMGVDFNTEEEFPPDDTGYGFDNIGDVLTLSPLLLEKYLQAAEKIVASAVPKVPTVMDERVITGRQFKDGDASAEQISFYKEARLNRAMKIETAGDYKVTFDFSVRGAFDFDPGRAVVVFKINDEEKFREELGWDAHKKFELEFDEQWEPGEQKFTIELQPLKQPEEKKTFVDFRLNALTVRGPSDPKHWTKTKNYDRFFPRTEVPGDAAERREYAREILRDFTTKAFRRPASPQIVDRLVDIAEEVSASGKTFEAGIAQATVAVLASPRFLFRVEDSVDPAAKYANIDEYALASRLSYFLWSTMPDEELFRLAEKGELRSNLKVQVQRLLRDDRSRQFVNNFTGQWLQVRDVSGIAINEREIFFRDSDEPKPDPDARGRRRFRRPPPFEFDGELRRAMQEETQEFFNYVMRHDRSVLELVNSDYTFVNERLAKHYGLEDVEGKNTRRVTLPEGSPRGGILTQGSVLVVTSNPTRTSLVKRGLFVLENFLGTPPPPPPPDIPELEEAEKKFKDREPTLREALELHRESPSCSSCHNRMDPLGFALENFNAMGMWREKERGQPIDSMGKLISGESFTNVVELKKIIVDNRKEDFYSCLSEKLLTYALGRGVEYYDVVEIDRIVENLVADGGKFSTLLMGVIESAPFQKRRNVSMKTAPGTKQESVATRE
jgi:hypothetical protein